MASVSTVGTQTHKACGQQPMEQSIAADLGESVKSLPSSLKNEAQQPYFDEPLQTISTRSSDNPSDSSIYSADNENERRTPRLLLTQPGSQGSSRPPLPAKGLRGKVTAFWAKNKGLALVILAQFFGIMMNVTTRLLELDGGHGAALHPFQILFARMTGTLILSSIYQWAAGVADAPFGPKEVWKLLVARGVFGFFGVYGIYYSLQYLPLSDATVITFLAPIVACWACSILLHEPFTRSEQVAGLVSFLGVILIARPTSLLPRSDDDSPAPVAIRSGDSMPLANGTIVSNSIALDNVTPAQRLRAVGIALVGVLGAAGAYTTIRWIGKRAHPLISVNYFAAWSTMVSAVALIVIPGTGFRLPVSLRQWVYLLFLGVSGFVMQFLLTAGLQHEKSSRATNMVYTQMLFALAFDKVVFDTSPGALSIVGSSLILGSALYVAVYNNNKVKESQRTGEVGSDEEVGLMAGEQTGSGEGSIDGRGPLRGLQEVQLRTLRV